MIETFRVSGLLRTNGPQGILDRRHAPARRLRCYHLKGGGRLDLLPRMPSSTLIRFLGGV